MSATLQVTPPGGHSGNDSVNVVVVEAIFGALLMFIGNDLCE